MVVPISASFGVVSCVSVLAVHWPTVAIYLGFAILQTIEHLTYNCNLFRLCNSSARWTLSSHCEASGSRLGDYLKLVVDRVAMEQVFVQVS
jgi:hypothetical protein